jgi:RNase P subunit RPR2
MSTFAARTVQERDALRLSDSSACPKCGELLIGPQSSSYLGLGRIEHTWMCHGCGEKFRTATRLAGLADDASA